MDMLLRSMRRPHAPSCGENAGDNDVVGGVEKVDFIPGLGHY
jgi:hypothetical protein